jgi:hypothetical protein
MRTRRLHARLTYVKRADNRASVAFAAASTFARTPRPPRVVYAEASCRPRLRGKKRLEVAYAHAWEKPWARAWEKPSARAHTLRQKQRESFRASSAPTCCVL